MTVSHTTSKSTLKPVYGPIGTRWGYPGRTERCLLLVHDEEGEAKLQGIRDYRS